MPADARVYVERLIAHIVSMWICIRLWIESTWARLQLLYYTNAWARRSGKRLVYAAVGNKRVDVSSSPTCTACMVDITPTLAYLFAAHDGKPSIGVAYRHINATTGVAPVTLIMYICDTSHVLSRAIIDMDNDCELLSQTDLSYIDISSIPLTYVARM